MLQGADNMPGKWQLLIFLGQQTILNMQKNNTAEGDHGIPQHCLAARICRESLLTKSPRIILLTRKGAAVPFSCLPAKTGTDMSLLIYSTPQASFNICIISASCASHASSLQ